MNLLSPKTLLQVSVANTTSHANRKTKIDEKYCNEFDFRLEGTLCSKNNKVSLIGFWIKDEINVGDPNKFPTNYIITRDVLALEKVYELDGTFIYKSA